MKTVAVVIPIYKNNFTNNEFKSLQNCINILGRYSIFIVCPVKLSTNNLPLLKHLNIVRFNDKYFESIQSYNRLMLSVEFYSAFSDYEYILIHQLDAWVFKDELSYWCSRGYHYIGAPWFDNGTFDHLNGNLWAVGNGGFSLRNVQKHKQLLMSNKSVMGFPELIQLHYKTRQENRMVALIKIAIKLTGYHNNVRYVISKYKENEDYFWGLAASKIIPDFSVAPIEDAIKFSFECDPEYLYQQNANQLPFGCHAWEKWGKGFWNQFI